MSDGIPWAMSASPAGSARVFILRLVNDDNESGPVPPLLRT